MSAPPAQIATDLSAPGAKMRWQSAADATVDSLKNIVKIDRIPLKIADLVTKSLKARQVKRAIKNHSGDFAAILVLLVLSVVVAGYILNHERLRFPFIQSAPFTMKAEFSTAQAVTPGQGQTVRVSGVQIGEVGQVSLQNGIAVVQLQIDQKYKHLIHTDATALLRPRTGLKDMFVELNPGTSRAPIAKPGFTIQVSNTQPDINVDEILASLDADTRQYLDLLVNGAGQGLKNNGGNQLAQVLERFEPTHQDLARAELGRRGAGREPAPAGQLAAAAQHRARDQAEPDRAAGRRELDRVPRLRLRGSERQPRGG